MRGLKVNIKEEFNKLQHTDMTEEYIMYVKTQKNNISNSDKRFLLSIIGKFKERDIDEILKAIKMYAIWEPNEAIIQSRKKGVFRYKAYGFKKNKALYLLDSLIQDRDKYLFSEQIYRYLIDKIKLSWLYVHVKFKM